MKIIAIEKDVLGVAQNAFTEDLLKKEGARAWELHRSGIIRELYFRSDRQAAVLVLECESEYVARAALGTLPLVEQGLIDFEIIPVTAYTGFERLFGVE